MSVCVSPTSVSAWNLDVELQKELDAVSIPSHLSSSSSSAGDDEYETKADIRDALLSDAATNAKLDMLLHGWRVKEKKLQEYEQSLKTIRLWEGDLITDEELRGKELEDKPACSYRHHADSADPQQAGPGIRIGQSVDISKPSCDETLKTLDTKIQRRLKQLDSNIELTMHVIPVPDFITHLGETPLESPRKDSIRDVNLCDPAEHNADMQTYEETGEDKESIRSEYCSSENDFEVDHFLMLRTRRTKMLEEFRAADLQRATELDQRRKAEIEECDRRMALASERRQELEAELLKEQKNKLATLESEQLMKMRLFEELQRTEEINLQSEKQEMEMRNRVLMDLSDTYKQLEEELDFRRSHGNVVVDMMLNQGHCNPNTISVSKPAEAAAMRHLGKYCTQIQAVVRGYLCRKKYKELRSQKTKTHWTPHMESVPSQELMVSGAQDSSFCIVNEDPASPASSPEGICCNLQLIDEVLKTMKSLGENGSVEEIYSCLELAKSIGLDEEASALEDRLHHRQESMQNWLRQVINGWDTGRSNLQKQFEESTRLELAPMYAVAEAVVFAREKEISEGLEMAIVRASRWDFYHWMCDAKLMGMEDVIRNSYQGFCRRLKEVKDSLEKETKLGTRNQYTLPLQEATSLSLRAETRQAMKVILKRVLQFVRRAVLLVGAKSNKHDPRAQDWKTVETEGAQIGLDMRLTEYLKQSICRSRALQCVKRVWITNYKVNGMGMPYELINKKHGSVAAWDNTMVYPLTDTETELPVILEDTQRPRNPIHQSLQDTRDPVDTTLRHIRKLWVMPHNWLEMLRLQSLWQQHIISERTSGLFSRSSSLEAQNFSSECNKPLSNHCAKMRESATSPFITGNFQENFTLQELRARQRHALDAQTEITLVEEHDDYDHDDEGHDVAAEAEEGMKRDLQDAELVAERVTTTPTKSCLTREMLHKKYNLDRKELRWVMRVDLINEGLTSLGTKGIFRWCPRLRCLSVDMNRLITFKQVFEGGEEYLEQLSARDNLLEDLTGLEGLQRLTVLHLDGNLLSQITPIKKHTEKENCTSVGDTIHDPDHYEPGRLYENCWSRLQVLTLSCNRLTNVSRLGSLCPNLEVLDLGSNQLITLGKGEKNALDGLQHLRVLDVGQNKLKSRSLWEGLKHCPELVSLVASRNHLTELPNHFGSVLLREIWLNGNAIKHLGCKVWLPSLQRLYLQDNLITSLEPLWGCPALEVLDLSFNCISEYSQLQHLSGFPSLRSLQLNDNPISEQEDHADYVLQAIPWLAELDNEAVSKASRDKAIATILKSMMEVVGVTFMKEKLARGDALLRGFTNPCSAHKISFNKREHNENRSGQFFNRNAWEVNDVMNGEADEASLWSILIEAKQLAHSSEVFQSLLTMNAELIKLGSVRVLSEAEFEARSTMTAYQQMTHGLKGKLHAATKERCFRVSKETDISGQHTYQRWPLSDGPTHVGSQSRSSGVSVNSDTSGVSHLEWCLEEHATFDPRAYTEIYNENTDYRLEAEAHITRVIKLQAIARARMARKRVKRLMKEEKERRELEIHKRIAIVQALWRGWRIRKQNILEYLKRGEVERKLHSDAVIHIQALWRGYITRLKFQQALKRAKYTDDDDFDYVHIDETDFLAGELALASYQPADMYLFAVGAKSIKASDTPAADNSAIQETKHELQAAKEERQQAMSSSSQTCLAPSVAHTERPNFAQPTRSISQKLPASGWNVKNQLETEQIKTTVVEHISPVSSTNNIKKSVNENATNFSRKPNLVSGTNDTQIAVAGAVTHSTERSCPERITNITEATKTEDVPHTKDSFLQKDAAEEHEFSKEVKNLDPQAMLNQQSLDDLLKSMGFASPFPSGTRSADSGPRVTPDGDCRTITKRLDKLISSSLDSENQVVTNERSDSHAGGLRRKPLSDDKKAAMEEIAKDWGFKNEKTAEAYFKARERTMKQAKNVAQQHHLRDPETRFKRFKAKLGGPIPTAAPPLRLFEPHAPTSLTANEQVDDCKQKLRERMYGSGFQNSGASPADNPKASQDLKQEKKLSSVTDVPNETKVVEPKRDSMPKDTRRTSTNCAHGEISPWHIPKLNLNSSLEAFLIRDGQDSRR